MSIKKHFPFSRVKSKDVQRFLNQPSPELKERNSIVGLTYLKSKTVKVNTFNVYATYSKFYFNRSCNVINTI